jgi:hypothetical protein
LDSLVEMKLKKLMKKNSWSLKINIWLINFRLSKKHPVDKVQYQKFSYLLFLSLVFAGS